MITLHFKNVGQGDSIIVEWTDNKIKKVGLIDCHTYQSRNPTLEYLKDYKIEELEFIILSHFHYDHFSGMADLFEYCCTKKINLKYFYHTMAPLLTEIYNRINTTKKIESAVTRFVDSYKKFDKFVGEHIPVSNQIKSLLLFDNTYLSFLGPLGSIYHIMANQLSRKVNKIVTTPADINRLSTIILIENETNCILLTADSVKGSFKRISISKELVLVQVPHHGSWLSIDPKFWSGPKKVNQCPAIFSVGDEPKDKLPNEETVKFFDKHDYDVQSTNAVYGINTYFNSNSISIKKTNSSKALDTFSRLIKTRNLQAQSKYSGDQIFNLLS